MKRLSIWIIILAWLSGTLGIIGAFTVLIQGARQSGQPSITKNEKQEITQTPTPSKTIIKYTSPEKPNNDKNVEPKKKAIEVTQPIISIKETVVQPPKIKPSNNTVEKIAEPIKQPVVSPPVPTKTIELPKKSQPEIPISEQSFKVGGEDKIFDQQELGQLLDQIKNTKQAQGIWANCIRVVRSKYGNNKRATSQIEMYLRNHNYSIAGKEESTQKNKGVLVIGNNDCIKIVVGEF